MAVTDLWTAPASHVNIVVTETTNNRTTSSAQQDLSEEHCVNLSTHLEYLAVKSTLTPNERTFVLGATHALKDQLAREAGSVSGRSRLTPKELLTEAERVLLRSTGGMSLLERLRRDG